MARGKNKYANSKGQLLIKWTGQDERRHDGHHRYRSGYDKKRKKEKSKETQKPKRKNDDKRGRRDNGKRAGGREAIVMQK